MKTKTPRTILLLTLASLLVASAALEPAAAGKARFKTLKLTKYYEGPTFSWTRVPQADRTCQGTTRPCTLTKDGVVEIGGVKFDPLGTGKTIPTVTIQVYDDLDWYGKVSIHYCETPSGVSCLDDDDRNYGNKCVTAGEKVTLLNVNPANTIMVYVRAFYSCTQYVNDYPADQGGGFQGRVVATYKIPV